MLRKMIGAGLLFFSFLAPIKSTGQSNEVAQLLLNVEKLTQFKQILSDMKKGYEILSKGYNTIRDLSQGNFTLHQVFLDGLLQVSPTVRNYKRVADIIRYQGLLVKEYKAAFSRFQKDGNFNPEKLAYLKKVYDRLFKESLQNLDDLATVLTANKLRMSDDERLKAIDGIFADMEDKLEFLRYFNNKTTVLAIQRAREYQDTKTLELIYGLPEPGH
ncbi:TerB family tellurite resistance protein [Sinomicrobium sp. FJxs]|uniref:TerB family tellurite resistance protein n=2 Tax=Sinomicrobium weinanense TaxID=2842200 RepID=A0A926JU90_9FLAO|nr:TerB family tellurite resistance protein [Sinomicrobium weinanense]MBU3123652.1 TerB family tellurite resistance protein [Sinomicrobium weinanense]